MNFSRDPYYEPIIVVHDKVLISRGGRHPKMFGTTNLLKHLWLNHASDHGSLETTE